jgi:hypothetical protein
LPGQQALRCSESDEILRRFDLGFEVFVFGADTDNGLLRCVRLSISNEGGIRCFDSMQRKSIVRSSDLAAQR